MLTSLLNTFVRVSRLAVLKADKQPYHILLCFMMVHRCKVHNYGFIVYIDYATT